MKQTALIDCHRTAGGKLVDFAGWELPINYGSQVSEHHAVRSDAGIFDVSHMTVTDFRGSGVLAFLRRLLANDCAKLQADGQALYSCMLNPQGGVIDDLIVYRMAAEDYRIISNAATRDGDLDWFKSQLSGFDAEMVVQTGYALLALQGPAVRQRLETLLPGSLVTQAVGLKAFSACQDGALFVACTGYTGEDGYELLMPAEQAAAFWEQCLAAGISPIGLGARDSLRLEAGMSLYGNDLDIDHHPLESGLAWTIDWSDESRAFVGRDALEAWRNEDSEYMLTGLVLEQRGVLRNGQKVYIDGLESGMITSGGFSPSLGAGIALARITRTQKTQVDIDIRGKAAPARVVTPPFVRRGQSCVSGMTFIAA